MMGEAFARSASTPVDREVQAALPALENCFRTAVRGVRSRLVTRTGRDLQVQLGEVRASPAREVLEGEVASGQAVWCPFHLGRQDLSGFVVMEARLLCSLVGRLFGEGEGSTGFGSASRPSSEMELSVGARMCRELFDSLERLWPPPHPPRFFAGDTVGGRHGVAEIGETVPMVVIEVRFGPEDNPLGVLLCALPGALVKGMAASRPAAATRPENTRVLNFERLMPVEVDMVVELARVELSLRALENLRVGDDLTLGAAREVCARVNEKASFFGEAGTVAGVRSFKIARRAGPPSTVAGKDR